MIDFLHVSIVITPSTSQLQGDYIFNALFPDYIPTSYHLHDHYILFLLWLLGIINLGSCYLHPEDNSSYSSTFSGWLWPWKTKVFTAVILTVSFTCLTFLYFLFIFLFFIINSPNGQGIPWCSNHPLLLGRHTHRLRLC